MTTWGEAILVIGGAVLIVFLLALWVIARLEKSRWPRPNVKGRR
jgi:hypothetical protein